MDENGVIIFIPYGSRLGFHVGGPASTMANIDYKFPQCVCYEEKMNVFNESGKGYWMEGFGCLRSEGENRPSRPGHIVILNDMGGEIMNVSTDVTATLREQMKHHEPIVCYEANNGQREVP